MPDGCDEFLVEIAERLADIRREDWEACAGSDNPFVSYDFLSSLEESDCASASAGWAPHHILIRDALGQVMACMPLYLKSHSHGEYIFDWSWAEAYERAGGRYYPKLLSAVPFTPVTGPRLLLHPNAPLGVRAHLLKALTDLADRAHLSSVHLNFIDESDVDEMGEANFLHRTGLQYHWHNQNFSTYGDFLATLTSRKRKALKKERRLALSDDSITIERLSGSDIGTHHWDALYAFYTDTGARKWGQPYLNRDFFRLIGERMADRVLLVMASKDGQIIAGALNFIGTEALYGRYWGCLEEVKYLHFELCYHQAIEAAIERGLKRVEAGAQGEHKIARGYLPVLTHSTHFLTDTGFRTAVAGFLDQERKAVTQQQQVLLKESPYRQTDKLG